MESLVTAVEEARDAILGLQAELPELQVNGYWNDNPSPPTIDMYPGSPFQDGAGFGAGNNQVFLTVRARVRMADPTAGQQLLLRMLDPTDPANVEVALAGAGWVVADNGISGFGPFSDDAVSTEQMLGCQWRVSRLL